MTHQRLFAIGLTGSIALTGAAAATELKQVGTIEIPGKPLTNFDISFIDQPTGLYYFSDRSNAGVDIFDTKTDRFVSRVDGFIGAIPKRTVAGKSTRTSRGRTALWLPTGRSGPGTAIARSRSSIPPQAK